MIDDDFLEELVGRPDSCDVRPWIERGRSGEMMFLGELEPAESLQILEDLFALDPLRIVAIDPDVDDEVITTNVLIVELPSGTPSRARFFQFEAQQAIATGFDPEPDLGQRFLMIKW